jgi:type IV pilus assembly protein PilA
MLSSIKQRMDREDEGFTLIELMVVLLIIAILLAIAIPTFLGARNTANARSTQENLRNALTAEQTNYTSNQQFANDLSTDEPSLTWLTAGATFTPGGRQVLATPGDYVNGSGANDTVTLEAVGKDNNCYEIYQSDNATADFTGYVQVAYSTSAGTCAAIPAPPATSAGLATKSASSAPGTWSSSF